MARSRQVPVDVLGVHEYAVGQGAWLGAALLVGHVEQGAHLGVLAQHGLVEVGDQRLAAGFQQRDGGLDDGTLAVGQHGKLLGYGDRNARCDAGHALTKANAVPGLQPLQNKGLAFHASI
jgi:hypothetical protein